MPSARVHHLEYYVNDLAQAREFWSWLFVTIGWIPRDTWSEGFDWADPVSGTYIVFVQVKPEHQRFENNRQAQGLNHIALSTDHKDRQTLVSDLREHGAKIIYDEPDYVCFEDPSGIVVEFYME